MCVCREGQKKNGSPVVSVVHTHTHCNSSFTLSNETDLVGYCRFIYIYIYIYTYEERRLRRAIQINVFFVVVVVCLFVCCPLFFPLFSLIGSATFTVADSKHMYI